MNLDKIIQQWQSGSITAEEAMMQIAATQKKKVSIRPATPTKKNKRADNYDVSSFLNMANAIVDSRKASKGRY
jgi:hypothetical protein